MSKKFLKTAFVIICVFCTTFTLSAEAISLSKACELALENSDDLKAAFNSYQKALNNLNVKSYLPSLSFSGRASRQKSGSTITSGISASAGLNWSISTKTLLDRSVDSLNLENTELTYAASVLSMKNSTAMAYLNVVSLANKVAISKNSLNNAEKNLARTQEMYDASKVSEIVLSQSKLSYESSSLAFKQAKDSYERAFEEFADAIGLDKQDFELKDINLPENITLEKLKAVAEKNIDQTTTIRKAKNTKLIASENAANIKASLVYPTVSASITLDQDLYQTNKLSASGSVGVTVPVDTIIPWSQNNASLKNLNLDLDSADITYEGTVKKLKNSVDNAISSVMQLLDTRKTLVSFAENAKRNFDLVNNAYNEGYVSAYELSSAMNSYTDAVTSVENNKMTLLNQLCSFASLVEIDYELLLEVLS